MVWTRTSAGNYHGSCGYRILRDGRTFTAYHPDGRVLYFRGTLATCKVNAEQDAAKTPPTLCQPETWTPPEEPSHDWDLTSTGLS